MKLVVGQRVDAVVQKVTDLGIFVTVGRRHGLIHHRDFAGNWVRKRREYHAGQELRVVVQKVSANQLDLSLAQVNNPALIDPVNQFSQLAAKDFEKTLQEVVDSADEQLESLAKDLNEA